MIQLVLSTLTFTLIGYALWTRRRSWRSYVWQEVLTLGIFLQGVGYLMCLPVQGCWLGKALHNLTGIAHIRDYLGHLAFLAAISCLICAVAYRLMPKDQIDRYMVRVEIPGALAAFSMLVCITLSRSTRVAHPAADFFDVPLDSWLRAYWIICEGTVLYLCYWLIRLLVVLRRDPQSRRSSDLFIASTAVGVAAVLVRLASVLVPSVHVPIAMLWALLAMSILFSASAAALSWRRNARVSPPPRRRGS